MSSFYSKGNPRAACPVGGIWSTYVIIIVVKLVAQIKLLPDTNQINLLNQTLTVANDACNYISEIAHKQNEKNHFRLHHLVYRNVKINTGLSAQMIVRCIKKVVDSYKIIKSPTLRKFGRYSAQPYDDRIFRFCSEGTVSIWTIAGRQKIPIVCGKHQQELLKHRKGQLDLVKKNKQWYLLAICDIPEVPTVQVSNYIGIDLGIVNIATDSEGTIYSGKDLEINRRKYLHRRKNLQKKNTKASKRKLRQIGFKQSCYQANINHCISKSIVQKAQRTSSGIVLEDLKGIRKRVTATRQQRARLGNWGFYQLRSYIEYKAKRVGVPVILIKPAYTSQECPECGFIDKKNRPTRDDFICKSCGHAGPSDYIAARNIRARAVCQPADGITGPLGPVGTSLRL